MRQRLWKKQGVRHNNFARKTFNAEAKNQIEYLKTIVFLLNPLVQHDFTNAKDAVKVSISEALCEINGYVLRFNNDCISGINKSATANELKELNFFTKADLNAVSNYVKRLEKIKKSEQEIGKAAETDPKVLESLETLEKEKEAIKKFLKPYKAKGKLDAKIASDNIKILKENISTLEQALIKNNMPKDIFENMLNLIQKTCLSAWGFNDIWKAIAKIESIGEIEAVELLPELNLKMRALNETARATQMFDDQLLKNLDGIESLMGKYPENTTIGKFLREYAEEKIGFRGRAGWEPNFQILNKEHQIANKGRETSVASTKLPGSMYSQYPDSANAFKLSFVPKRTANLCTMRDAFVAKLNTLSKEDGFWDVVKALEKYIDIASDGKITAKNSYTNVINNAGLSAHCGPSGTTGEIVSVLYYSLGKQEEFHKIFEGILTIAHMGKPLDDFDASAIMCPVSLFMEIGDFHTTAEVLGGIYSVAVAEYNIRNQPKKKLDTDIVGYRNLLEYFKTHKEQFLGSVQQTNN